MHFNRFGGIMVSVLASSAVDRGVKPKTMKLVFVASSLSIKEKDWLVRDQNNVSEWSDMSTHGLL